MMQHNLYRNFTQSNWFVDRVCCKKFTKGELFENSLLRQDNCSSVSLVTEPDEDRTYAAYNYKVILFVRYRGSSIRLIDSCNHIHDQIKLVIGHKKKSIHIYFDYMLDWEIKIDLLDVLDGVPLNGADGYLVSEDWNNSLPGRSRWGQGSLGCSDSGGFFENHLTSLARQSRTPFKQR